MKTGVSCVALGFGLFTATLIALAQTTSPSFVAQAPSSAPPSGVLATPPPAPVSVPPSGVLATVERHVGSARPLKTTQNAHKSTPKRRHVVHHWTAPRHDKSTRPTTLAQNIAPIPSMASPAAEEGHSFLSQLGKAKGPAQ